jgi:hypothetical protein
MFVKVILGHHRLFVCLSGVSGAQVGVKDIVLCHYPSRIDWIKI